MDDLLLQDGDIPQALRDWLNGEGQAARLVAIERMPDGNVLLRRIPDIDPALVMRVRETFAQYREALMNLT